VEQLDKKYHLSITLFAIFWIIGTAFFVKPTDSKGIYSPQKGFLAPDFSVEAVDGTEVSLSDFKNQVVLLNLWASWCSPCKAEMPAMEKVYQALKDRGFSTLAVNITTQDDISAALKLTSSLGLNFPILFDLQGNVEKAYRLQALPTSYFIDRKGIIHSVVIGGPMPESLIYAKVSELLDEGE
jgi:cytochrome c biogenesis protein CcmG/thiol:disulfide interchange protein DsbE